MEQTLQVTGSNLRGVIKNSIKSSYDQFVWKIDFGQMEDTIQLEGEADFSIRDCYNRKVDAAVKIDQEAYVVRLVPSAPYKLNQCYYLHITYGKKRTKLYVVFKVRSKDLYTLKFKDEKEYLYFVRKEREMRVEMDDNIKETKVPKEKREMLSHEHFRARIWPLVLGIIAFVLGLWPVTIICMIIQMGVWTSTPKKKLYQLSVWYNKGVDSYNQGDLERALEYWNEGQKLQVNCSALERAIHQARLEVGL